jgi:hypothetical protein
MQVSLPPASGKGIRVTIRSALLLFRNTQSDHAPALFLPPFSVNFFLVEMAGFEALN